MVQVLVLAGNAFQPFPSDGLGVIQSMSGSHLQLGAKGQAARDSFAQQVCALVSVDPQFHSQTVLNRNARMLLTE